MSATQGTEGTGNAPPPAADAPPEEGGKKPEELTASSTFKDESDLRERAPEVIQGMMQSVAYNMCRESDRHQKEMKKKWREMSNPR